MRPLKPFDRIATKTTFKKDFKKLDSANQEAAKEAIKEIEKLQQTGGELPSQRQCKIRKGEHNPDRWQIRLTGQYRLTFHYDVSDGETRLVFRRVAAHRQIGKSS